MIYRDALTASATAASAAAIETDVNYSATTGNLAMHFTQHAHLSYDTAQPHFYCTTLR